MSFNLAALSVDLVLEDVKLSPQTVDLIVPSLVLGDNSGGLYSHMPVNFWKNYLPFRIVGFNSCCRHPGFVARVVRKMALNKSYCLASTVHDVVTPVRSREYGTQSTSVERECCWRGCRTDGHPCGNATQLGAETIAASQILLTFQQRQAEWFSYLSSIRIFERGLRGLLYTKSNSLRDPTLQYLSTPCKSHLIFPYAFHHSTQARQSTRAAW